MSKKERSRIGATWGLKCPACREGSLFRPVNKFTDLFEMHDNCPNCNQQYELEIGFYWGAMYVAYALSSAASLGSTLVFMFVFDLSMMTSFVLMFLLVMLVSPSIFRLARSIWLHAFVKKKE